MSDSSKMTKEQAGMSKVLDVMKSQFNTNDPLVLCKYFISFLTNYSQSIQRQRYSAPQVKIFQSQSFSKSRQPSSQTKISDSQVYPSRKTRWVKNITQEQQKQKFLEEKTIAFAFIEHGLNYHYNTQFFPEMPPKTYRCYVEAINNQTVNDIVDFLRYECSLQVQRLNRDQKRSIRTQLTKIKDWLGNTDYSQLATYYTFIRRHYDKAIKIQKQNALKLYKTILCIIRSPFVNVLETQQIEKDQDENIGGLNKAQAKAMIISYIKWRDLNKVSDLMCQKYGYDMKWSFHSVKNNLKLLVTSSINKLKKNFKPADLDIYKHYFTYKNISYLQDDLDIELKIKLYSYYLQKKSIYAKVTELAILLRGFFDRFAVQNSEISVPILQKTPKNEATNQTVSQLELTGITCKEEAKSENKTFDQSTEIKKEQFTEDQDTQSTD